MLSLSTPEYVVRNTVSAISSAIEKTAFLNSSKAIGSRLVDIGTRLLRVRPGLARRASPGSVPRMFAEHAGSCNRYHTIPSRPARARREKPRHDGNIHHRALSREDSRVGRPLR